MSYKEYIAFKERHRNKLLIFVSHADGKRPDGRAAIKVMYDASLKIWSKVTKPSVRAVLSVRQANVRFTKKVRVNTGDKP